MLRCALNLTHDGTVAIADGSKVLASVEMEKLDNRHRWSPVTELADIERVCRDFGVDPSSVDRWLVDGWVLDEPVRVGTHALAVAPYREASPDDDLLEPFAGSG